MKDLTPTAVLLGSALLWIGIVPAQASNLPQKIHENKARLESIHQNVSALRAQLADKQKTQAELRSEIAQLDQRIQSTQHQLQGIQQQRQQTQQEISELQGQIDKLQQELQTQKKILADQLRAAYMLGGETPLAVWLQTEKPAEIGRLSVYYRALAKARLELIAKTQTTSKEIIKTQERKKQQESHLAQLAAQTQHQETTLEAQRNQHATLEEQLVKRIAADQAKIANLQANANILNGLVQRLSVQYAQQLAAERAAAEAAARKRAAERLAAEQAAARAAAERRAAERAAAQERARIAAQPAAEQKRAEQLQKELHQPPPPTPVQAPPIATVPPATPSIAPPTKSAVGHGSFPPPVSAPVRHLFGTPRVQGGPNWQGITFAAPASTPVHAIAPGMVLYAGPLRGYGEIVIVQQANLVLAIYGHLAKPAVQVGQKLQTGSLVGTVGSGGEMGDDGLYLEIRSQGHPVNPLNFIR